MTECPDCRESSRYIYAAVRALDTGDSEALDHVLDLAGRDGRHECMLRHTLDFMAGLYRGNPNFRADLDRHANETS